MEGEPNARFQSLREIARQRILEILDMIQGQKFLAIDPSLVGPLSLIIEMSVLKEHGVSKVSQILEKEIEFDCRDVIYICRPTIQMMQYISGHVKKCNEHREEHRYHLYMCPRATTVCEKILISNNVMIDFDSIDQINLFLIPLENDLLSMQMDKAFREIVLERDFSIYHYIARSILQLEHNYGPIQVKEGKGFASSQVLRILKMLEDDDPEYINEVPISVIHSAVLIDREIDMITPLCTPLTYEALIDEVFGIANNIIKVNPRVLENDSDRQIQISLTSADNVFQEIRDLNFCVLKPLLVEKLEYIDNTYKEKDQQKSVEELSKYMKKFKQAHKEASFVQNHLHLAIHITNETVKNPFFNQNLDIEHSIIMGDSDSQILDNIERLIGMGDDLTTILRLLCLLSVTQNGLKSKFFDFFRRELLQTYGFEHILTLSNLEKAGLLKKQEGKNNWNNLVKAFKLIKEDVNQRIPDDIAYAYAGYAPLSIRLVESLYTTGWNTEAIRNLPGEYSSIRLSTEEKKSNEKPLVLLFFVGGVTFAEIAAIRYLNRRIDSRREFVVATTHLINSKSFIDVVSEKIQNEIERSSID